MYKLYVLINTLCYVHLHSPKYMYFKHTYMFKSVNYIHTKI